MPETGQKGLPFPVSAELLIGRTAKAVSCLIVEMVGLGEPSMRAGRYGAVEYADDRYSFEISHAPDVEYFLRVETLDGTQVEGHLERTEPLFHEYNLRIVRDLQPVRGSDRLYSLVLRVPEELETRAYLRLDGTNRVVLEYFLPAGDGPGDPVP